MSRVIPSLFVLFFLAGCASQQDLNAVKWEVDALKTRVTKSEDRLKEKDRLTTQGLGQQAELQARITELQEQISLLQGNIEELKVSTRGTVKEERLLAMEKEIMALKSSLGEMQKQPPKSLFDTGMEKYRAGRFADALSDFKSFLSSSPDPALVDDAQFWIGETYYSLGKYEDAILQYDMIEKKFGSSERLPEALFKEGISFYKSGDKETGDLILQRLIQTHPNSEAATKAKKIMKEGTGKG